MTESLSPLPMCGTRKRSLSCNQMENPLGYTLDTPRANWECIDFGREQQALGCRVEAALSEDFGKLIYDSGMVRYYGTAFPIPVPLSTPYPLLVASFRQNRKRSHYK